ncbi:MAG: PAS domain S-box protein [Cyanobacteria bacterium P01_A01_bin.114]
MHSVPPAEFTSRDFERFFSLSTDVLAIAGEDGYFKCINPALGQILELSETDWLSQPFLNWVHPDDRAATQAEVARLIEGRRTIELRNRYQCKDGRWKWLEWNVTPFRAADRSWLFYCIGREATGRHLTEQALEDSERRFQAIFNQTFQFIGLLSPDGLLLEANETALTFGGFSAERVIGKPFWDAPWWQQSDAAQQQLRAAIAQAAQGKLVRYETDVLGPNGTVTTIDFSIKPLRDDAGNVVLLIPEGRDITERKAAEADVRRLNADLSSKVAQGTVEIQRYVNAIENMQDGFHLWQLEDPDDAQSFRLLVSNPAAEQLLAKPNSQMLGKRLSDAMPALSTEVYEVLRQAVITEQGRELGDIDYPLTSGDVRTLTVKIFPLADRCLGVLFNDVTEQRRSQQQLIDQKEQLRIIFDQAGVGIARLSIDGRWIQANDKLCEIFAYPREELFQTSFQDITHPDDAAADRYYYQALLSGELENATFEKRYLRKDGKPVWCNVAVSVFRDEQQQPQYFIAFIEDITERKTWEITLQRQKDELAGSTLVLARTMTELDRRNQELDQFAYVASHDLKAPLRAIANLATWLEEDIGDRLPDDNRQQLELLQGRVHRMENLIDGLLAYSRAGRSAELLETVDLNQLLRETIDLLAPPPTFTIDVAPDLPTILTNHVPLTHVFANLVSNAIKHHPRTDGHIQIRCQPKGDRFYEFVVIDNGRGIDPAYHSKIFNIFQVLEARDKVENTGIGLAIVKKIVEAEGGTIAVESEVGQGTTFRFTWPKRLAPRTLPS